MELCTAVQTINPSSVGCGMWSRQSVWVLWGTSTLSQATQDIEQEEDEGGGGREVREGHWLWDVLDSLTNNHHPGIAIAPMSWHRVASNFHQTLCLVHHSFTSPHANAVAIVHHPFAIVSNTAVLLWCWVPVNICCSLFHVRAGVLVCVCVCGWVSLCYIALLLHEIWLALCSEHCGLVKPSCHHQYSTTNRMLQLSCCSHTVHISQSTLVLCI